MPQVTIVEGREIIERLEEQANVYRRIIDYKISASNVELTEEPVQESEVIERKISRSSIADEFTLDQLNSKIDSITTEKNRILVAMRQFESTQKFTY